MQPSDEALDARPMSADVAKPIDNPQVGVPAPKGYSGPWPMPGMDGGDPENWLNEYNERQ